MQDSTSFKIFSFYNHRINPAVPKYQKAVFNYLGFDINHVVNGQLNHGDFLNYICRHITDTEHIIIFDIDCIPLHKNWIDLLMQDLSTPRTLVGAAQTANHLRNAQNLYISPFFFGISTAYLKELDYPEMHVTSDMDAGQNLTEKVSANGGNIKYWWPTSMEEEKWYLHHPVHNKFGFGTTYNNAIYHAFYSRENLTNNFIKKCKSVLPWQLFNF